MASIFRRALVGVVAMVAAMCWSACAAPPVPQPAHPGAHVIADGPLTVEIMDPNDPAGYYRGVRFTPVAAVIRANYDGHEFLFHKADPDPLVDVAGLFGEFDLAPSPPGFADAAIGQPFVKVGVGALRKTEPVYHFFTAYPVERLATTRAHWTADAAEFGQSLTPVNGYGYDLAAWVSVSGRTLLMEWTLTNTGTKAFTTHQYLHNCFSFDGQPVGPDYVVRFPFDFAARKMQAQQRQEERSIVFEAGIPKAVNIEVDYPPDYRGLNTVTVRHEPSGMQVDCRTSLPGERVMLHAAAICVCPEQFGAISLKPGETRRWTRRYIFSINPGRELDNSGE